MLKIPLILTLEVKNRLEIDLDGAKTDKDVRRAIINQIQSMSDEECKDFFSTRITSAPYFDIKHRDIFHIVTIVLFRDILKLRFKSFGDLMSIQDDETYFDRNTPYQRYESEIDYITNRINKDMSIDEISIVLAEGLNSSPDTGPFSLWEEIHSDVIYLDPDDWRKPFTPEYCIVYAEKIHYYLND